MKTRRRDKLFYALFLCLIFLMGCSAGEKVNTEEKEAVVIPAVFRMDPLTNRGMNLELVNQFNEAYEGEYRVEVEWIVDNENGYRRKLKQLNAVDKLPAVITDVGFDAKFIELLIDNDRLMDLSPYMEGDVQWQEAFQGSIWDEMQGEDGTVYVSPVGNMMYSTVGIIYNKEILEQAGYAAFPETWEDFFRCLRKLKEQGITPLALHGAGNYWVPMLFSSAYIARKEEGRSFLAERLPESYQNASIKEMMEFMRELYSYSYEDALDIEYIEAEQRFYNGEAAIIANGPWMFMELEDQKRERYDFCMFPEKKLIGSWEMTAWAVVDSYPEEIKEGAVAFLKFRTLNDYEGVQRDIQKIEASSEEGIMQNYQRLVWDFSGLVPNYQIYWDQNALNDYLIENLPGFIKYQMGIYEFIRKLNEAMKK